MQEFFADGISCLRVNDGAGGGSRTHMPLLAADFESAASAISPLRLKNDAISISKIFYFVNIYFGNLLFMV